VTAAVEAERRPAAPGVSYVLPLRWSAPGPIEELVEYLRSISREIDELIVVDGSPPPLFAQHAEALDDLARHLPPHPDLDFAMGKVNGVLTGVREARCELVVLADDDVRYEPGSLQRTVALLAGADLVRPQNYFDELPWHARWDGARSLLNRVVSGDPTFPVGDFPGTLALRRSSLLAVGGYDGDALFENLELMRTIAPGGGGWSRRSTSTLPGGRPARSTSSPSACARPTTTSRSRPASPPS